MRFAKNVSYFLIFRIWGNHIQKLDLIYEVFLVRDYMIFYYAHNADIFIVWIVSGYRNLDTLFSEDSNV